MIEIGLIQLSIVWGKKRGPWRHREGRISDVIAQIRSVYGYPQNIDTMTGKESEQLTKRDQWFDHPVFFGLHHLERLLDVLE
jgi:hypothetical protein